MNQQVLQSPPLYNQNNMDVNIKNHPNQNLYQIKAPPLYEDQIQSSQNQKQLNNHSYGLSNKKINQQNLYKVNAPPLYDDRQLYKVNAPPLYDDIYKINAPPLYDIQQPQNKKALPFQNNEKQLYKINAPPLYDNKSLYKVNAPPLYDDKSLYKVNAPPLYDDFQLQNVSSPSLKDELRNQKIRAAQIKNEQELYKINAPPLYDNQSPQNVNSTTFNDEIRNQKIRAAQIKNEKELYKINAPPLYDDKQLYKVNAPPLYENQSPQNVNSPSQKDELRNQKIRAAQIKNEQDLYKIKAPPLYDDQNQIQKADMQKSPQRNGFPDLAIEQQQQNIFKGTGQSHQIQQIQQYQIDVPNQPNKKQYMQQLYTKRNSSLSINENENNMINYNQFRKEINNELNNQNITNENNGIRLRDRIGYFNKHVDNIMIHYPQEQSSHFIDESQRFNKNFADNEKQLRDFKYRQKSELMEKKREENYKRELNRWDHFEKKIEQENRHVDYIQKRFSSRNSNSNKNAYNILTTEYQNTQEGQALRQKDEDVQVRKLQKSKYLDSVSNQQYDVVNGSQRKAFEAHENLLSQRQQSNLVQIGASILGDGYAGRPLRGMDRNGKKMLLINSQSQNQNTLQNVNSSPSSSKGFF